MDREAFERDYKDWLLLMSRDAAHRLAAMPPERRNAVMRNYYLLKNPRAVFHELRNPDRMRRLGGEGLSSYIVLETDSVRDRLVVFFPSICSPAALDFAVAMNKRFFCERPLVSHNFSRIEFCGITSISPEEKFFGEELSLEFKSWSKFS